MASLEDRARDAFEEREAQREQAKAEKRQRLSAAIRPRLSSLLAGVLGADWETAYTTTWEGDSLLIDGALFSLVPSTSSFQEPFDVEQGKLYATVARESAWATSGEITRLADLGALYEQAASLEGQFPSR